MQEVNKLVERASALLADGTVDRVGFHTLTDS